MVLNLLSSSYYQFIMNYNTNNLDKIPVELHGMLKTVKAILVKTKSFNLTSRILAIRHGAYIKSKTNVRASNLGLKIKADYEIVPNIDLKEVICFYC